MAKNYKYSADVGETFNYGRGTNSVYADTITEVRKKIYNKVKSCNWHKTGSDPCGYVYAYGMRNFPAGYMWGIKDTIAYLSYDKGEGILWWIPFENGHRNGREMRIVKSDGTLGMTQSAYWKNANRMRGF